MRIFLNDYELGNPADRIYLNEPVEGLELPSIRTSRGSNTGQHGGWVGPQFFGQRAVTINGHVFSDSLIEGRQKRREIQSHLPLRPTTITVRILDDDGMIYTFDAYVVDFKMPILRSHIKHIFKIELEAADSVIYDDAAGSALEATINQAVPGGYQFTSESPQFGSSFYFSPGQPSTTVTNTSEVTSYPIITITGAVTNPVFTNRTTGKSFRLDGYAVDSTAVTVIDMGKRTVKLNGGNAFAYAPVDVDWFGLVPGDNLIEFTSGSGGDVTSATASWRPGYWGI